MYRDLASAGRIFRLQVKTSELALNYTLLKSDIDMRDLCDFETRVCILLSNGFIALHANVLIDTIHSK